MITKVPEMTTPEKDIVSTLRNKKHSVFLPTVVLAVLLLSTVSFLFVFQRLSLPTLLQNKPIHLTFVKRAEDNVMQFDILQIADIHLGEAEALFWGPEQDRKTWIALDRILSYEQPDLLILSGDQLTSNNVDANATTYYRILGEKLSNYGIPFGIIFGNHDEMALEIPNKNGTIDKFPAKTSRLQLVKALEPFDLSVTQMGPSSVFGTSNYWVDIHHPIYTDNVTARVLLLDTGGGMLPERVDQSQIDWVRETYTKNVPTIVFQHIPPRGFTFDDQHCHGSHDDAVTPVAEMDAGIIPTLIELNSSFVLAFGHDHGNSFCCSINNASLHLCFGRHSGYGGYGMWERGSRVYRLSIINETTFRWKSWVRTEHGQVIDEYEP